MNFLVSGPILRQPRGLSPSFSRYVSRLAAAAAAAADSMAGGRRSRYGLAGRAVSAFGSSQRCVIFAPRREVVCPVGTAMASGGAGERFIAELVPLESH